jgi:tetratricopeptide (TPR) repeat protein/transcriptional regulator with XRE-family HTH domain
MGVQANDSDGLPRAAKLVHDAAGYNLRPDPLDARTSAEFIACLRAYRAWCGQPSFRAIAAQSRFAVSHATIRTALGSDKLPGLTKVLAIVAGCGGGAEDQQRFASAWRRIVMDSSGQEFPTSHTRIDSSPDPAEATAGERTFDAQERDSSARGLATQATATPRMAIASTSSFGQLLKRLRTRVGMTQEELADAAGMSVRTISDLERGVNQSARRDTIYLLANALKLSDTDRRDFEWVARRPNLIAGTPQPPRTLPRDISAFTDRGDELRVLGAAAKGAGDSAIYAIGGMAGIGKTALAVHAAHVLAPRFPDGQIFLSLHAHTPGHDPVDPVDALGSLLQTIGSSADRIPASLEDRASLWRDRLSGKKVLLVLDDAADSDQVLPLMPGTTGNLTLVTSRKRLHALEGAIALNVGPLPPDDAADMLVRLAARPGLDASDPAVAEVCRLCGYLPLAIGLLARRMRHHDSWSTDDFAAELAVARDRLSPLSAENLSVSTAFDLTYQDLSSDERRMFRRLGLHPGTEIDPYAAAALNDVSLNQARAQLDGLFNHYLLTEPARGRYQFHDLIREHARLQAESDPPEERSAAVGRLMDYYLYGPDVDVRALATVPAVAAKHPKPAIPAAMRTSLRGQDRSAQALALRHAAVDAAHAAGVRQTEARALTDLGDIQYLNDDCQAAAASLNRALQIFTELGDRLGQADALRELAAVLLAQNDHDGAIASLARVLDLYASLGDKLGTADALRELSAVQQASGNAQDVSASLGQALELYRELDDLLGQADTLNDLGAARMASGDYKSAAESQRQALELYRLLGDRLGEANALTDLGAAQHFSGAEQPARANFDRAFELFKNLNDQSSEAEALNNLGELALKSGDPSRARALHNQALGIATNVAAPGEQARAHEGVGRSYLLENETDQGEEAVRQAVAIYQKIGSPHVTSAAALLRGKDR